MSLSKLFPVLQAVFTNPKVIFAFAAVIIYWSFFSFVLYYRKRPPKSKHKKPLIIPTPAAPAEGSPATVEAAPASEDAAAPSAEF